MMWTSCFRYAIQNWDRGTCLEAVHVEGRSKYLSVQKIEKVAEGGIVWTTGLRELGKPGAKVCARATIQPMKSRATTTAICSKNGNSGK